MTRHRHHLEAPVLDEEPEVPTIPETEPTAETEPLRESADTVRQLMDTWYNRYHDKNTPPGEKAKLAYRMVRMSEALQAAHLLPEEVKIREAEADVLGFYVPGSGEIAITTGGLALDPIHFKDVLVHEAIHAGKLTAHRISDEGWTQLHTESRVSGAMSGIYEGEKKDVEKVSEKIGFQRMLEAYDFEKPDELIHLYLSVEWDDAWKERWHEKFAFEEAVNTERGRKYFLELPELKQWQEELAKNFKAAAPRLFEQAESAGFIFSEAHDQELMRVIKNDRWVV